MDCYDTVYQTLIANRTLTLLTTKHVTCHGDMSHVLSADEVLPNICATGSLVGHEGGGKVTDSSSTGE